MKKAYFWKEHEDADTGIAVIAENSKEARQIGYDWWGTDFGHNEDWIEQRCKLIKDYKDIQDLPIGAVDNWKLGLERGLYGYVEDECPICWDITTIYYDEEQNKVGCDSCLYPIEDEQEMGELTK